MSSTEEESDSGEESSGEEESDSGEEEEEDSGEEIDVESSSDEQEEVGEGDDEEEEEEKSTEMSEIGKAIHGCVEEENLEKLYHLLTEGQKVLVDEDESYEMPEEWEKEKKIILHADVDIDEVDSSKDNRSALHKAVELGNADIVFLLLKCGADPNARLKSKRDTCLHVGLRVDTVGKVKCFHKLLQNGGNFELKNNDDQSPIELSVILNCESCTRLMLEYGADVSAQYNRKLLKQVKRVANIEDQDEWKYDHYRFRIKDEGELAKKPLMMKNRKLQEKKRGGRTRKWEKMILCTNRQGVIEHKKLKKRIRKGVPDNMRKKVWMRLLPYRQFMIENEGLYYKLLKKSSNYTRQIDVDINRTFREHGDFRKRYGEKQIALFNVLKAYSNYDIDVGYCQGMSYITAMLLMYIDDEEVVFWFLVILMKDPKYDLQYIFLHGFPKLMESFYIHEKILEKKMKKLHIHFQDQNLHTSMYATKWYMLLMLDILPFDTAVRIWEIFFSEGKKVIFSFIYSLLKILEPRLMKLTFERILPYFQELPRLDIDSEKLVLMATKKKIKRRVLDGYGKKWEEENKGGFKPKNVLL